MPTSIDTAQYIIILEYSVFNFPRKKFERKPDFFLIIYKALYSIIMPDDTENKIRPKANNKV